MSALVLVDTSVWVNHLRCKDALLAGLLGNGQVSIHPMVVGELACGNLQNRKQLIGLLQSLPQIAVASHEEVLVFLDNKQLMGKGIGYVDLHLLASVFLAPHSRLWTYDRRLETIARDLGVHWMAAH